MFGSKILEVAVSLAFVYLLLSLICSSAKEMFAALFGWRAKTLEGAIKQMLVDPNLARQFYGHPLIQSLTKGGNKNKPSYIPARTFAITLLDLLASGSRTPNPVLVDGQADLASLANLRTTVTALPVSSVRTSVLALLDAADNDLTKAQQNIEHWFDDTMERVSGAYKRKVQYVIIPLAVIVTLALNVDTISIADRLYKDNSLRALAVAAAQQFTNRLDTANVSSGAGTNTYAVMTNALDEAISVQGKLQELNLPIGWSNDVPPFQGSKVSQRSTKVFGWLITVVAVSLGAPFWFDVLGKLANLRLTGKPPDKSQRVSPGS